ncbi:MAG: hypothetical protein CVU48_06305 [Candidatus Cloacimonetes bacterium HGW-Cloacimonetes-1]|jgi:hypothetical protein|nr:MAG: hypothetical protein CVU48_06305 [Candidatus Cloacimonetes bacterium HGW-Cloacimonetes-1]
MKRVVVLILALFTAIYIYAIEIPYSKVPVKTADNRISDYVRVDPKDKLLEATPTNTWLWYDEDNLYALFESEMTPDFMIGNYNSRDYGYDCDFVRIQLITIPEAFFAYYYIAMPNGSLYDGVRNSNMGVDNQWNSSYSYESDIGDSIWTVLMTIPLGELRFQQKCPYQWKVICTRYYGKEKDFYSAPYADTEQRLDYFAAGKDITLTHKVKKSLDLQFKPYYVKSYDLVNKTQSYDPENVGMDIAFNPGSRTRIKVSMNPDYSDVPMDNASDVYNSKYPQYFNENRFFFTEDIDALGVNSEIFYSRNIVQPQLAFKLTGNNKAVNYGILGAIDKEIKDEDYIINSNDYYQVLSVIPNWRRLYLRGTLISRTNDGYYNHVFDSGIKWEFLKDLWIRSYTTLSIQKNDSETGEELQGALESLNLKYRPNNWDLEIYYTRITKDIKLDAGYFWEGDMEKAGCNFEYSGDATENYVKSYGYSAWAEATNRSLSADPYREYAMGTYSWIRFRPDYSFNCNVSSGSERGYDCRDFGYYSANMGMTLNKWDALGGSLSLSVGKGLIYQLNDTYNRWGYNYNLWGNLVKRVNYSFWGSTTHYAYEKETLVTQNGQTQTVILDNAYNILNGSLSVNPNIRLRISNGVNMTTYASAGVFANIGFYSNLRYEFKPECFFNLGYKTRQFQDEQASYDYPLGHYSRSSASAYLKLSYTM